MTQSKIIYTYTDEAPALATESLLPLIEAILKKAKIAIETKDISLAGRILSQFADRLPADQQVEDALAELGKLVKTEHANIIKLPNISASVPQLTGAIKELQRQGFKLPDYPANPNNAEEEEVAKRYAKVLGSAVNPVLREGNSDRRVAPPVKEFAKANPHSMGAWSKDSKTHVASMASGDFYGSEKSWTAEKETSLKIEFCDSSGASEVLKTDIKLQKGEVVDAAALSVTALRQFFKEELATAKDQNVLASLHMKATMMKVSDPIIFGHAVAVYYGTVLADHGPKLEKIGFNPRNGIGDLYSKIGKLSDSDQKAVRDSLEKALKNGPKLAMVDSDKGITNLHVPSDVIIDASMPAAIRSSGQMWGPDGQLADTKAMIPDRSYAAIYQETIEFCQKHGAFDPRTMGNVANVGLMAQKAEEYGSHDKTFEMPGNGSVKVTTAEGETIFEHAVEKGDIWRMCQTKDAPIRDWVRLAVQRAKATGAPSVFWLDENRAHDAQLIKKVSAYLKDHDTGGLDIQIKAPREAMAYTLERVRKGDDTISVTGNVLRDYLTDLFPILELGTSAKMLSIVPLLAGGGLFETGAGGTAPKHVEQLVKENHLRWDSLGEFLALGVSLEHVAETTENAAAKTLATTLNQAIGRILTEDRSPSRKVGEIDNRGSHFYLALYWTQALAAQSKDKGLQTAFSDFAEALSGKADQIASELIEAQGTKVDIGGYFRPQRDKAAAVMRPSKTLNELVQSLN